MCRIALPGGYNSPVMGQPPGCHGKLEKNQLPNYFPFYMSSWRFFHIGVVVSITS